MAIVINNFKNVYGINNLKGISNVNGNALIYAPNGGTKTSLALGFKKNSAGELPNDRIFGQNCEYSFSLNDEKYTNVVPKIIKNIVVYNFDSYYRDTLTHNGNKMNLLTVSSSMQKKYGEIYYDCYEKINLLSIKISLTIGNKKKEDANISATLDFFKNNFKLYNWKDIIMFLSKINFESKIFIDDNICDIFNENTNSIIFSLDFNSKVNKLIDTLYSKTNSFLFSETFGSQQAKNLIDELKSDGFFEAGHAIKLSGYNELITSYSEFEKIYNEQLKVIYEDEKTQIDVEDLLKKLNKNKATREIKHIISNQNVLLQMNDMEKFRMEILSGKLQSLENEIKVVADIIEKSNIAINNLIEEAKFEQTKWEEICEVFKDRFTMPFEIKLSNKFSSIIGENPPTFEIIYNQNGNEKIIDEELLKESLSTGQLRALTILHFLFDLNISIKENDETFVILDDIVDSFDYKNKYAMIQYISELSKNNKIILWILTHNFDFFSSCYYRISKFEKFYIKQNRNSENFIKFNSSIIGGGLNLFKVWANTLNNFGDEKKFISLIPVCRNLLEVKYDKTNYNYILLTNFLHYRRNTKTITVNDVKPIFYDTFNIECPLDSNKKIFDILFNQLQILSTTDLCNTMDLDIKIIFSIGIRLVMEMIFNKFDGSFIDRNLQLGEEFEKVKENFDKEDIRIFSKAIVSVPEFIHLNSFMYEPLIDIPTSSFQSIYKDVLTIKDKYNIEI